MAKPSSGAIRTAEQKIRQAEWGIANQSHETAIVFDKDGTELMRIDGDESSVSLSKEFLAHAKGAIVTHNHPVEGVSVFSSSDIRSDGLMLPAEARMVTKQGQLDKMVYNSKFSKDKARLLANRVESFEKA